jgi:hypothetical protein
MSSLDFLVTHPPVFTEAMNLLEADSWLCTTDARSVFSTARRCRRGCSWPSSSVGLQVSGGHPSPLPFLMAIKCHGLISGNSCTLLWVLTWSTAWLITHRPMVRQSEWTKSWKTCSVRVSWTIRIVGTSVYNWLSSLTTTVIRRVLRWHLLKHRISLYGWIFLLLALIKYWFHVSTCWVNV